jgi:hypothetical protein
MRPKRLVFDSYRFPAEDEPDGDVLAPHHFYVGALLAWFGFMFVWPYYPEAGAAMTIVGTLVLIDDVVSHAFGVWTPLDAVWKRVLWPIVRRRR